MTPEEFKEDTITHIQRVRSFIDVFIRCLYIQGSQHDASKLKSPELEEYRKHITRLKEVEYGSEEYKAITQGPMLDIVKHHYMHNRHHPQHFENGISGMNLLDLVEMFCDWAAAVERNPNGSLEKSVEFNIKKFNLDPQTASILRNSISIFK